MRFLLVPLFVGTVFFLYRGFLAPFVCWHRFCFGTVVFFVRVSIRFVLVRFLFGPGFLGPGFFGLGFSGGLSKLHRELMHRLSCQKLKTCHPQAAGEAVH